MQISENFGYGAAIAAVFFEARRKAIARMGKKARFEAGSGSVLLGENSCSPPGQGAHFIRCFSSKGSQSLKSVKQ